MKTRLILLFLLLLPFLGFAQPGIWMDRVVANQIDFRQPKAIVLDSIIIDCPVPGKVLARFDGNCSSTPGDRIVLAASDYPSWNSNDGNTNVTVFDSNYTTACFDHARFYSVNAGTHTYYAVGQNFVDLGGSGIASVKGNLTVQFVPDGSPDAVLSGIGFVDENWAWMDSIRILPSTYIDVPGEGQLVISLDAFVTMPYEEQVLYTTSLEPTWPNNPVAFPVNFPADYQNSTVMHRQELPVTAGPYTIHALARFLSGDYSNTYEYIYGTLSAQYIRENNPDLQFKSEILENEDIEAGDPQLIGQLQITAPRGGKVWLQCTGICHTSLDDRIRIYLVPAADPNTIISDEILQPILLSVPDVHFSLSGLDSIGAGTHTYNLMADYDDASAGTLHGDISGLFSIQYFANPFPSKVEDISASDLYSVFPNPTNENVFVRSASSENSGPFEITIFDVNGQLFSRRVVTSLDQYREDLSGSPEGEYLVKIRQGDQLIVKSIVKCGN